VLYRPKMGFGVPLAQWFRGTLRRRVRDAVLGARLMDTGMFDAGLLRQLVDQHESGLRDHSAPLWSLLMFDAFIGRSMPAATAVQERRLSA
jgi:asparagine synthase (glutamine-hydrolysing)